MIFYGDNLCCEASCIDRFTKMSKMRIDGTNVMVNLCAKHAAIWDAIAGEKTKPIVNFDYNGGCFECRCNKKQSKLKIFEVSDKNNYLRLVIPLCYQHFKLLGGLEDLR